MKELQPTYIQRLSVTDFGAIKRLQCELAPRLQCFFGPNESGKTTIIDAILRALSRGKGQPGLIPRGRAQRYEGPNAHITVDLCRGQQSVRSGDDAHPLYEWFTQSETDTKSDPAQLSMILRLLTVRASDHAILSGQSPAEQRRGWDQLKQMLTGTSTPFHKLIATVRDQAGLTKTGKVKREQALAIEARQNRERQLHALSALLPRFHSFQEDHARLVLDLSNAQEALQLESLGLIEEYKELIDTQPPHADQMNAWLIEATSIEQELDRLQVQLSPLEQDLDRIDTQYDIAQQQQGQLTQDLDDIARVAHTPLFQQLRRHVSDLKNHSRLLDVVLASVGGMGLAVGTLWLLLNGNQTISMLAIAIGTIATMSLSLHRYGRYRLEQSLVHSADTLFADLKQGISISELSTHIEDLLHTQIRLQAERDHRKQVLSSLYDQRTSLRQQITSKNQKLHAAQSSLQDIYDGAKCSSQEQLTEKVEAWRALRSELDKREAQLQERLGGEPKTWLSLLDKSGDGKEREMATLTPVPKGHIDTLRTQIDACQKQIRDLEYQFREARVVPPESVLDELETVRHDQKESELNLEAANLLCDQLGQLHDSYDAIFVDVFVRASKYFRSFTDGRWDGLRYHEYQMYAIDRYHQEWDVGELSSGTYDQALFAVRLAIIQLFLGDRPAFLLLDDPFLTADSERKACIANLLHNLSIQGWQLLYFSCDQEMATLINSLDQKALIPWRETTREISKDEIVSETSQPEA